MDRKSSAPVSSASASSHSPSFAVSMRIGVHTPSSRSVAADLVAVHARQHDVEDHGRVAVLARSPQALEAVVHGLDLEALGGEPADDGVGQTDLVLHEQHAHRTSVARGPPAAGGRVL